MTDGTGPVGVVTDKVGEAVAGGIKSVLEEIKSQAGFSSKPSQNPQSGSQNPQYQQTLRIDEQQKEIKLQQIRERLKMERHRDAQMLGVAPPAPPPKEETQEDSPKNKQFETVSLPGSKNTHTDLGLQQSQSFTKAETGRNIKG